MRQILSGGMSCVYTNECRVTEDDIRRTAGREVMRSITESTEFGAWRKTTFNFLVAMRLGDTPVLIPNTMVKT